MQKRPGLGSCLVLTISLLSLACGGGGTTSSNQIATSPVASIALSPRGGPAPLVVTYDGTASEDPAGGALTYLWEFSNGTTSTTPTGSVTFSAVGTFAIRLTVTNQSGHTGVQQTLLTVGGDFQESDAHRVLYLTNLERRTHGVPPVKGQANLEEAAYGHALDMGQNDYFSHTSLDGRTAGVRITAAGYVWWAYGENIASGQGTPESVMESWKNSPGHHANIIGPSYRELGMGVYVRVAGSKTTPYWVQDFGLRSGVYPVVIEDELFSTTNPIVNLYVYGTDWASQMMISEDPNFTGAGWQAFSATPQIQLSAGTGLKHVYVRIRNSAGTVKNATDEIVLQ